MTQRGREKNPTAYEWRKTRERLSQARSEADEARWARDKDLAVIQRACQADRRAITKGCKDKRARARSRANRAIEQSRQDRAALREAHNKGTRAILRSEHDDQVEQNLSAGDIPIWRKFSNQFKWRGISPDHRAELFMEWLEENPDERHDWWDENAPSDHDFARAERAHHYRREEAPF